MVFYGYLRGGNNISHELHDTPVFIGREPRQQQQGSAARTERDVDAVEAGLDQPMLPETAVILKAKSVSYRHARLDFTVDVAKNPGKRLRCTLTDLKSLNGTFLNHDRIVDGMKQLRDGDLLRFGYDAASYTFRFTDEEDVCKQYMEAQQEQKVQQGQQGIRDYMEGQEQQEATLSFPSAEGVTTVPLGYGFQDRENDSEDDVVLHGTMNGINESGRQLGRDDDNFKVHTVDSKEFDKVREVEEERRRVMQQEMESMKRRLNEAESEMDLLRQGDAELRSRLHMYEHAIRDLHRIAGAMGEVSQPELDHPVEEDGQDAHTGAIVDNEDRALHELQSIKSYLLRLEKSQQEGKDKLNALRQRGIERYASVLQLENTDLRVKVAEMDEYINERYARVDCEKHIQNRTDSGQTEMKMLLFEREWEVEQLKKVLAETAKMTEMGSTLHVTKQSSSARRGYEKRTTSIMLKMIEREQHLLRLIQEHEHRYQQGMRSGERGEENRNTNYEPAELVLKERNVLRQSCQELQSTIQRQMSDMHVLMSQKEHKLNEWKSRISSILQQSHLSEDAMGMKSGQLRDPQWLAIQQQQSAKRKASQFIIEQLKQEELSHHQTQLRLAELARQLNMSHISNAELKLELNQLKDVLQYTNAQSYHSHVTELQNKLAVYQQECGVERVVELKRIISELAAEAMRSRQNVGTMYEEHKKMRLRIDNVMARIEKSSHKDGERDPNTTAFCEDPCIAFLEQRLEQMEEAEAVIEDGNDGKRQGNEWKGRPPSPPPPPARRMPLLSSSKNIASTSPKDSTASVSALQRENERLREMMARQVLLENENAFNPARETSTHGDIPSPAQKPQQPQQPQQSHSPPTTPASSVTNYNASSEGEEAAMDTDSPHGAPPVQSTTLEEHEEKREVETSDI